MGSIVLNSKKVLGLIARWSVLGNLCVGFAYVPTGFLELEIQHSFVIDIKYLVNWLIKPVIDCPVMNITNVLINIDECMMHVMKIVWIMNLLDFQSQISA